MGLAIHLRMAVFVGSVCAACGGRASESGDSSSGGAPRSAGGSFTSGAGNPGSPGHGGGASEGGTNWNLAGSSNTGGTPASGGHAHGGSSVGGADPGEGGTSAGAGRGGGGVGGSVSGSGTGGAMPTAPGTVTPVWEGFCVATFTSDYDVFDPTLDPTFGPRAGERYLITSFGVASATLGYLTSGAFIPFSVGANPDGSFPFTSNCAPDPPLSYVAVFANVRVFSDAQLTHELCDLEVGAAMPFDESKPFGSSLQSQGPAGYVYKVSLNALGARCGGATEGHILVHPLTELGATRILVPIAMLEVEPRSD